MCLQARGNLFFCFLFVLLHVRRMRVKLLKIVQEEGVKHLTHWEMIELCLSWR